MSTKFNNDTMSRKTIPSYYEERLRRLVNAWDCFKEINEYIEEFDDL